MLFRDLRPGIALFHLIGDLLHLGGVQKLRQMAQVHDLLGGDIFFLDLHLFGEGDGNGILIGDAGLELRKKLVQCAPVRGGTNALTAHIQAVSRGDQADLIGEVLLQRLPLHQVLTLHPSGLVAKQVLVNGIGGAQGTGGDALQVGAGLLGGGPGGNAAKDRSIVAHGGSPGIHGEEQCHRRHTAAHTQEDHRVSGVALHPGKLLFRTADGPAGGFVVSLSHPAQQAGDLAPSEKDQLDQTAVGLREMVFPLRPDDAPPAAAGITQEMKHFIVGPLEEVLILHKTGGTPLGRRPLFLLRALSLPVGMTGGAVGFFGVLAHKTPIVSGPLQTGPRKSYNLLPFPIISFFMSPVNPKGGEKCGFPLVLPLSEPSSRKNSGIFSHLRKYLMAGM